MHSTPYLCIAAFWLIKLSLDVVALRRKFKVRLGDGGQTELMTAQRIQGNAAEYLPIALILLTALELNRGPVWSIHLFGLLLLAGRFMHARALKTDNLNLRVRGMQMTFLAIGGLAAANFIFYLLHLKQ